MGTDGQKKVTAINEQYIPIGYNGTLPFDVAPNTANPVLSNSLSTSELESSKSSSINLIVVVVIVMSMGTIGSLFFYFKKRKREIFEIRQANNI